MKILISTAYLSSVLEKALIYNKANKIHFRKDEWLFKGNKDVFMYAHHIRIIEPNEFQILEIDREKWLEVMVFVKKLPEQPIVLELIEHKEKEVKIRLEQFVADF